MTTQKKHFPGKNINPLSLVFMSILLLQNRTGMSEEEVMFGGDAIVQVLETVATEGEHVCS